MIEERNTIMAQHVVVDIIGRRTGIPDHVLAEMDRTIELSAANTARTSAWRSITAVARKW